MLGLVTKNARRPNVFYNVLYKLANFLLNSQSQFSNNRSVLWCFLFEV